MLQRVLAGILRDDQQATAACCKAFRGVIRGPRYQALRQEGGAQRGIVVVASPTGVRQFKWRTKKGKLFWKLGSRSPRLDGLDDRRRYPAFRQLPESPSNFGYRCLFAPMATSHDPAIGARRVLHGGAAAACTSPAGTDKTQATLILSTRLTKQLGFGGVAFMPHACMCQASGVIGNQLFIRVWIWSCTCEQIADL